MSAMDTSLFIWCITLAIIRVLIYVDGIIITGKNPILISRFIHKLNINFSLKNLGNLSFFPGIEMCRTTYGLYLTQTWYITNLFVKAYRIEMLVPHQPLHLFSLPSLLVLHSPMRLFTEAQ